MSHLWIAGLQVSGQTRAALTIKRTLAFVVPQRCVNRGNIATSQVASGIALVNGQFRDHPLASRQKLVVAGSWPR